MTVSPPHSASLVGLLLKPFGLPWVAQFHDPWVDEGASGSKLLQRVTRHLEGRTVTACDLVLNATEEVTESLASRYPSEPREKFDTLHNGFDPLDFPPVARRNPTVRRAVRLTHTGSLYGGRNPYPLFAAVARLVAQGAIKPRDLEIRLIGDCGEAMGRSVENEVKRLGVEAFIRIEPPVSYPAALEALADSDALLLFAQNQPLQVPAKLFEYLHLRRFILAFTSGATARIISETASGLIVDSDDINAVTAALRKTIEMARNGVEVDNKPGEDSIQQYTAISLAQRLASRLDEILASDSADESPPCRMTCVREAMITPR
jgi:glycosyltransferase involved in cell wall biosynthesis